MTVWSYLAQCTCFYPNCVLKAKHLDQIIKVAAAPSAARAHKGTGSGTLT